MGCIKLSILDEQYKSGIKVSSPQEELTPDFCVLNVRRDIVVKYVDPTGMVVEGVSEVSAMRVKNEIHNSFQGEKFSALRDLFQLDGNKMKQIDEGAFNDAISGLSSDEKALANAYFSAINAPETHYVDMTMSYETLNSKTTTALGIPANMKGSEFDAKYGAGANVPYGTGTLSLVVMDSKNSLTDFIYVPTGKNYSRRSTAASTLAHELLGHGYSRIGNRSTTYEHKDAIQMENLYWRVRGYNNFYRDGTDHGTGANLGGTTSRAIPNHFRK